MCTCGTLFDSSTCLTQYSVCACASWDCENEKTDLSHLQHKITKTRQEQEAFDIQALMSGVIY